LNKIDPPFAFWLGGGLYLFAWYICALVALGLFAGEVCDLPVGYWFRRALAVSRNYWVLGFEGRYFDHVDLLAYEDMVDLRLLLEWG